MGMRQRLERVVIKKSIGEDARKTMEEREHVISLEALTLSNRCVFK